MDFITKTKHAKIAGLLIGISVVANIQIENKYVGAMLFSVALLTIIHNNLLLYTGKIGFLSRKNFKNNLVDLLNMLFDNSLYALVPSLIYVMYDIRFENKLAEIALNKFGKTPLQLFLYAALCGVLIFVAVYSKNQLITVFCIMTFILSGFEHCIADVPYLIVNFSKDSIIKYGMIVLGNTFGAIVARKLIVQDAALHVLQEIIDNLDREYGT